jgi:hypothetical protein
MRRFDDMARLFVKCRECRAIVDTGVDMDLASFCTSEFEDKIRCSVCRTDLDWDKDDVLAISFCSKNANKKAESEKLSRACS